MRNGCRFLAHAIAVEVPVQAAATRSGRLAARGRR